MQQQLMLELADHLQDIVNSIRSHCVPEGEPHDGTSKVRVHGVWAPQEAVARAREVHPLLGSHQEMIIERLAEADPKSLTASQINTDPRTQPNTHMALDKLVLLGLVKASAGRPKRYLLGSTFD